MTTQIQRQRLQTLHDWFDSGEADKFFKELDIKLNLAVFAAPSHYISRTRRGCVACLVGAYAIAQQLNVFPFDGLTIEGFSSLEELADHDEDLQLKFGDANGYDAIAEYFGLSEYVARGCFGYNGYGTMQPAFEDVTRKLQWALNTQEIDE